MKKEQMFFHDNEITIYYGSFVRDKCVQFLNKKFQIEIDGSEIDRSKFNWFSLQITTDGRYKEGTFRISPILWVMNQVNKTSFNSNTITNSLGMYEKCNQEWNKKIITDEQEVIPNLHNLVRKDFIDNLKDVFNEDEIKQYYLYKFNLYANIQEREKHTEIYTGLRQNFYIGDLEMVSKNLTKLPTHDKIIQYIDSVDSIKDNEKDRINVLDAKSEEVKEIVDIKNTPLGKWPSKYGPCYMQQLGINLAISDRQDIFSINGPPGTGKTTLLKEIVANNVVERANLLAQYEDPDDAFCKMDLNKNESNSKYNRWYKLKDDSINKYGILVVSNNNAAVENISKELPFANFDKNLKDVNSNDSQYLEGLKEVRELLDITSENSIASIETDKAQHTFKDIYFTEMAKKLFEKNEEKPWGLISAPVGSNSNILKLWTNVLFEFRSRNNLYCTRKFSDNTEKSIVGYKKARRKYNEQRLKVEALRDTLQNQYKLYSCNIEEYKKNIHIQDMAKESLNQMKEEIENKLVFAREELKKLGQKEYSNLDFNENQIQNIQKVEEELNTLKSKYISQLDVIDKEENDAINEIDTDNELIESSFTFKERFLYKIFKKNEKYEQALKRIQQNDVKKEDICKKCSIDRKEINLKQNKIQELLVDLDSISSSFSKKKKEFDTITMEVEKIKECIESFESKHKNITIFNEAYVEELMHVDADVSTKAHVQNPWITEEYNREREKLFIYALDLHKEFCLSSDGLKKNIGLFAEYNKFDKNYSHELVEFGSKDKEIMVGALYQSIFLMIPVLSSTFASIEKMFKDVKNSNVFGTLIIDEAGQATPQSAIGALYRFRKCIVVGDPKQVEPIVSDEMNTFKKGLAKKSNLKEYCKSTYSVQTYADKINKYGSILKSENFGSIDWVGSPLVVHRRCISPMFEISNELSYGGIMKKMTQEPKNLKFTLGMSQWINVFGVEKDPRNHFVEEQAIKVCEVLEKHYSIPEAERPSLFIISPFKTVVTGIGEYIENNAYKYPNLDLNKKELKNGKIGTVHKFQGKEADEVIFLMGCDLRATKAASWVSENIVNVAVTRAKYRLYVIGDSRVWENNSSVALMKEKLDSHVAKQTLELNKSSEVEKTIINAEQVYPTDLYDIIEVEVVLDDSENINENDTIVSNQKEVATELVQDSTSFIENIKKDETIAKDFFAPDFTEEQLSLYGFQSNEEIMAIEDTKVKEYLIQSMRTFYAMEKTTRNKSEIDYSICASPLGNALEKKMKDNFKEPLIKYFGNKYSGNKNKQKIKDMEDKDFTLGAFETIIRNRKKDLGKISSKDEEYWKDFQKSLKNSRISRNNASHGNSSVTYDKYLPYVKNICKHMLDKAEYEGLLKEAEVGKTLSDPTYVERKKENI